MPNINNIIKTPLDISQLVNKCKGQSQFFLLPRPDYLFDRKVNRLKKQDVHTLRCVVKDCERLCKYVHPICDVHAVAFFVSLKPSTIESAGNGLFISKSVRSGTHIMNYTGIYMNNDQLIEEYDNMETRSFYKINVDEMYAIDSRSTVCGLGRYLNHHPSEDRVNVAFEYDEDNQTYKIVTIKDIRVPKGGEVELFIDYGDSYWYEVDPELPTEEIDYDNLADEDIEEFIEPEDFPIFPSYATVVCTNKDEFPQSTSVELEELLKNCEEELILLSMPAQLFMDPFYLDLNKKQNIVEMDCMVKNCKTICTYTHPLCRKHLKEGFHIEVRTSDVANAGRGVFLLRSVRAGSILMLFTGCYRRCEDLYEHYKRNKCDFFYLFEGPQRYAIDARSTASGLARYINHQNDALANVEIQARPHEAYYTVVTKRDILVPKGGAVELFTDYGEAFWINRKQNTVDINNQKLINHSEAESTKDAEPFLDPFPTIPAYASVR